MAKKSITHINKSPSLKHLTGINTMALEDLETILSNATCYAESLSNCENLDQVLKGKIILNLFFEDSTRTRTSFEIASKRLGAHVVNWNIATSAFKKGESFDDTIRTLNAMRPDGVIIRHFEYGAPEYVANHMDCPVINAGDSWREHPTQALLDALTIRQTKGTIQGLNIAICGDIAHSRVANSNILLLSQLGAHIHVIAPSTLMPQDFSVKGVKKYETLAAGLKNCDIVMVLRIQKERLQEGASISDAEYFNQFGLTLETLKFAKKDALVMHPGPINRGVEISDEVADDPERSLILKQVSNGIPVRMAVLKLLIAQ